jgi:SAM-dependent methyltransferase
MLGKSKAHDAAVLAGDTAVRDDSELLLANRLFYDPLWSQTRLVEPHRFNTWPLVQSLLAQAPLRLEVAPGLRPRLPIDGTQFVDISVAALAKLRTRGASVAAGSVMSLPFSDGAFDLVCSLDIVEHVDDDERALSELSRVCAQDAVLLLSAPLHMARWTAFDEFVGHRRRYEPAALFAKLARHGLTVSRSAVFGMRPRSSWLTNLSMWWLTHRREHAMWWYNQVFMPLGLRFTRELVICDGIQDTKDVDELLLVCRKA